MISTTYVFLFVLLLIFFFLIFFQSSSFIDILLTLSFLCLLVHSCRSQYADNGSMYMMNWVETPAAQALPHAHGDTMRGEVFLCGYIWHIIVMHTQTQNSLHHVKWVNSLTAASNMISQLFIIISEQCKTSIDLIQRKWVDLNIHVCED